MLHNEGNVTIIVVNIYLKALCDIVLKCLDEAEQWKTQTIAVPSLGTGLLKYPADKVASLMFQCIEDFSSQNLSCHLKTVSIVIHNSDTAAYKVCNLMYGCLRNYCCIRSDEIRVSKSWAQKEAMIILADIVS